MNVSVRRSGSLLIASILLSLLIQWQKNFLQQTWQEKNGHIYSLLCIFPLIKMSLLPPPRLVRLTAASSSRGASEAARRHGGTAARRRQQRHCGADAEFFFREKDFSEAKCAEATRNLRINGDGLKLLPPYSCCPPARLPPANLPPGPFQLAGPLWKLL